MSDAVKDLIRSEDPNLLVSFETADDGAVYRVSDDIAIITTVDFITPPVDDPWWFGQIAAANSISDIYAMGGWPLTALNVVMFPEKKLVPAVLAEILRGGAEKVAEAGASVVGGHTVEDPEPKYGLSVTGMVHPDNVITNAGAKPGDALILTKPIGTGVLFNSSRSGKLPYEFLEALLPTIAALNNVAMELAKDRTLHSCTDITGFGVVGHAHEMAAGSGVDMQIEFDKIPFYPHAVDMYKRGETTGSNITNRLMTQDLLHFRNKLDINEEELLFDPQTSGGLLIALPEGEAEELLYDIKVRGNDDATIIGRVTGIGAGNIDMV